MEKEPLISIVVPIYNLESYVRKCLGSLVGQSYANLEIVVVDDGSSDGSHRIIEEFAHADARVKPVYKSNEGVSLARRDGIEASTGDYIFFIDGDDYLDGDCIRLLVDAVRDGADIAAARIMRVTPTYCSPMPRKVGKKVSGEEFFRHLLRHDLFAGVASIMYRGDLLRGLNFYPDATLWEDFLMNLQIALKSAVERVSFVDEALYYYVQRPGSGNRLVVSLEYLQKFGGYIEGIFAASPERIARCPIDILANRIHWYYIYISKGRNPWIGDTPFAVTLYADVGRNRRELIEVGVAPSVIKMIRMYRHRWMRPAWRANALARKWKKSYDRRRAKRK